MPHVDDEELAALALGAEPDQVTDTHLRSCAACRADLDALTRVVTAGRAAPDEDRLVSPPSRVWDAVQAEIRDDLSAEPVPVAPRSMHDEARTRGERRRPSGWIAVAASFVAGLLVAGGVAATLRGLDEPDPSDPQEVEAAQLESLGSDGTGGTARVVAIGEQRFLDIEVDTRTPGDGYREVWLLDPEGGRLVSLGVLVGTESRLAIPDGLELGTFSVVDVSREPLDGDPSHSTDSIARGTLGQDDA